MNQHHQGGDTTSPKQRLTKVIEELANITIDATTETELAEFTLLARTGSRRIEHLLLQIAAKADRLHARGRSGSAKELLVDSGHVSASTATREADRARTTAGLPRLGAALATGSVSGEHIDTVGKTLKALGDEQRAHLDTGRLTELAIELSPDDFSRAARQLADRARQDWGLGRAIEDRQKSELKTWHDKATGMGRISGWLDPGRFAAFKTQLDAETASLATARKTDPGANNVSKDAFLAMDALVSLVEKGTGGSGPSRPTVFLHVDAETATGGPHDGPTSIRETDCGHHVPPETVQRFLCDSVIQPIIMKDGVATKVGRKARTATDAQLAALKAMYDSCAWARCTTQVSWCQMHHIKYWENGGNTDLSNLIPLCSHHHHKVHEEHWGLCLASDRTLQIKKPGGETWRVTRPGRLKPSHANPGTNAKARTGATEVSRE